MREQKHGSGRIGESSGAELSGFDRIEVDAAESGTDSGWAILPLAFVAGFLLNLMPCVLPVVALKMLAFVQQANESRRRVLLSPSPIRPD